MQSRGHLEDFVNKPDVYHPNVLSPYFRSPFTDIFGSMINHQQYGRCGRFELNMMECMEAYGLEKGRVKCAKLIDDFNECQSLTKQFLRQMVRVVFELFFVVLFLWYFHFFRRCKLRENGNIRQENSRKDMHHHHIQMLTRKLNASSAY